MDVSHTQTRLYQQAFEKAAVGLGLIGTDGHWLAANDALCRLLGYPRHQLAGIKWNQITHPDDIEAERVEVRALRSGATDSYSLRKRCIHADGEIVELQVSVTIVRLPDGTPEFFVVQLLDVPRAIEDELNQRQQEKIRLLVENVSDGFIGMDEDGYITEWNRQAERILQWTAEETIGRKMAPLLVPERFRERHHQGLHRFIQTGTPRIINKPVELPLLRRDGSEITTEMTIGAVKHLDRYYFATFVRDISARKELEQRLHRQATHDHLTGLLNRFEFMSRLQRSIDGVARGVSDGALALMFIDLDGFKQVNDTYGHHAGDQVLTAFASRLQQCVRRVDVLARLAGDEFVVLICGMDNIRADVETVARKVLDAAGAASGEAVGETRRVSASVGIALYDGSVDAEGFLQQSDAAMYVAKQAGKNRYVFHCDLVDDGMPAQSEAAPAQVGMSEQARLDALYATGLLDTDAEPMFDRLTTLASRMLRMPMAFISLVDRDRQWFKSRCGIADAQTSRVASLCTHTISRDAMMIVPDTRKSALFAGSPLVTGAPFVRFYAGVPLHGQGGELIGTFCVADHVPRSLSQEEVELLSSLARMADDLIGLRQLALVGQEA